MRLFVGIPMAASVIDELSAATERLSSSEDGLRWSARESWHITLQFLGKTSPEQYECLVARLGELRSPSVPIQLEALGFFERAGIFKTDVEVTPELLSLQQLVTAATAPCGYVPETRPYHPHVTLARSKGHGRVQRFCELKSRLDRQPTFTGFVADEFLLYESVLGPGGSRYGVLNRFPLKCA
jgi:2'-5' RNA ligase